MDSRPSPDPVAFKNTTRDQWDRCAAGWNAKSSVIRAWLHVSTEALLRAAEIVPGARVLDIAAGSGDQTLDIASRVGRMAMFWQPTFPLRSSPLRRKMPGETASAISRRVLPMAKALMFRRPALMRRSAGSGSCFFPIR